MAHQQTGRERVAAVYEAGQAGAPGELETCAGALAHGAGRIGMGKLPGCVAVGAAAPALLLAALLVVLSPAAAQAQCCVNPTSETTQMEGEDPGYTYATDFTQYINENLNSGTVKESNGEAASDTCHFSGSSVPAVSGVIGSSWNVLDGTWGPDIVGWLPYEGTNTVTYYRNNKRDPCMFTVHQELQLSCNPHKYVGYPGNKLTGEIVSTSQVKNCRTEQLGSDSIQYGAKSACQTLDK